MSDNLAKGKLLFDIDGFFKASVEAGEEFEAQFPDEPAKAKILLQMYSDQSVQELFNLYYLAMRSALVICDNATDEANAKEALLSWRKSCLGAATALCYFHVRHGRAPEPDWLEICQTPVLQAIADEFPAAREVEVTPTMEPRLYARARNDGKIVISSLVRGFLCHYNMVLFSDISAGLDVGNDLKEILEALGEPDLRSIARFTLPYFIYSHDFIHVAMLPYISVPTMELYSHLVNLTNLQTMLMIAHEYGHILFGHTGRRGVSQEDRETMEGEADDFAIKTVFAVAAQNDQFDDADVWTAYRWFYQYQVLDEVIGALLRGREPKPDKLEFERRREPMLRTILKNKDFKGLGNLYELRGTYVLLSLKHMLIDMGSAFLREVANLLAGGPKGGIKQWWEKIPMHEN